jgi:hypothetical protein
MMSCLLLGCLGALGFIVNCSYLMCVQRSRSTTCDGTAEGFRIGKTDNIDSRRVLLHRIAAGENFSQQFACQSVLSYSD